jgi:hypothetical protein
MATNSVILDTRFAGVLRAHRDLINERVAQEQSRCRRLESTEVNRALLEYVQPVMLSLGPLEDVVDDAAEAARRVDALVSAALTAAGQQLLGRVSAVNRLWTDVLPQAGHLLSVEPNLAGELTTALARLIRHHSVHRRPSNSPASADRWVALLNDTVMLVDTPEAVRRLGVVTAWRCGLAHYRSAALSVVEQLPEAAVRRVFDISSDVTIAGVSQQYRDRWADPHAEVELRLPGYRNAAQVGSYRGMGGQFVFPPLVGVKYLEAGNELIVASGTDRWAAEIDVFGATLHRVSIPDLTPDPPEADDAALASEHLGELQSRGALESLGPVTSAVIWEGAFVFTTSGSYSIRCVIA